MYIREGGGYPMYIREGGTRCTSGRGVPDVHQGGGYPMYIREGVPNGVINWPIWEYTVLAIDFQIYKGVLITPLGRGVPDVHQVMVL